MALKFYNRLAQTGTLADAGGFRGIDLSAGTAVEGRRLFSDAATAGELVNLDLIPIEVKDASGNYWLGLARWNDDDSIDLDVAECVEEDESSTPPADGEVTVTMVMTTAALEIFKKTRSYLYTGASVTLDDTHKDKYLRMYSASDLTVTVGATVTDTTFHCHITRENTGEVIIACTDGRTVNGVGTNQKLANQYDSCLLYSRNGTTWVATPPLVAV